eukprot:168613-Chlamydomonas_euryale.AAC.1
MQHVSLYVATATACERCSPLGVLTPPARASARVARAGPLQPSLGPRAAASAYARMVGRGLHAGEARMRALVLACALRGVHARRHACVCVCVGVCVRARCEA